MKKISSRLSHSIVDELGLDPLKDRSFDAIQSVTQYKTHNVTEDEEFNLPFLSYKTLGTPEYWWAIVAFNNIADPFSVKRGTRLKIPDLSQLMTALSDSLREENKVQIVEI